MRNVGYRYVPVKGDRAERDLGVPRGHAAAAAR